MKVIFKKAVLCVAAVLFLILNTNAFSAWDKASLLPLATADQSESKSEEETGSDFNFIKSNENVKDFLYDGSLLLYGGTALVAISVIGIVVTFLPRRRKKRKIKKQDLNRRTQK